MSDFGYDRRQQSQSGSAMGSQASVQEGAAGLNVPRGIGRLAPEDRAAIQQIRQARQEFMAQGGTMEQWRERRREMFQTLPADQQQRIRGFIRARRAAMQARNGGPGHGRPGAPGASTQGQVAPGSDTGDGSAGDE